MVQVDRDGDRTRRGCECPCCRVEAVVHLLETGREGHALAVMRGLPGALAIALEVAREEGRRQGILGRLVRTGENPGNTPAATATAVAPAPADEVTAAARGPASTGRPQTSRRIDCV
jgi:hypothetical protein